MRIWYHFLSGTDTGPPSAILSGVGEAGIDTYPLQRIQPQGPGLVFFQRTDPEIPLFLSSVSGGGRERVLAIGVAPQPPDRETSFALLGAGASDVLHGHPPGEAASQVVGRLQRWEEVDELIRSPLVRDNLVGGSAIWLKVLRQLVEVARFTEAPALVTGETGTGKELAARLIHSLKPHPKSPDLVVLDCTTVVPELSGSEFFGHERGAFTGAIAGREGAFELADGGTLFLDEVGELPLQLQAELLRVIQEGTYKRIGSNTWRRTDFRLVCATNRDLEAEVAVGRFRRDLFYRIAGWICRLPPLRDRREDILLLAPHFLSRIASPSPPQGFAEPVRDYLLARDYPGNVRDLKHLIARMAYRHLGPGPITVGAIPEEERGGLDRELLDWRDHGFEESLRRGIAQGVGLKGIAQGATDMAIRIAVAEEGGNLQRAARRLGVTDRALQIRRASRDEAFRKGTSEPELE